MSNWAKPNVKCICIRNEGWFLQIGAPKDSNPPEYRKVCTITQAEEWRENHYIKIEGYSDWYQASCFRPLHTATESEDLAVFRRIADLAGVDEALRVLNGEDA